MHKEEINQDTNYGKLSVKRDLTHQVKAFRIKITEGDDVVLDEHYGNFFTSIEEVKDHITQKISEKYDAYKI